MNLRGFYGHECMILTCPACSTSYQVDGSRFTPTGRKVRCAKCGHSWFQEPVVTLLPDEPPSEALAEPEPYHAPPPPDPEPEPEPEPEPQYAPEPEPVRVRPSRVFVDESVEPEPQPPHPAMAGRGDRRSARFDPHAFGSEGPSHRRAALKWLLLAGGVGTLMALIVFMRQTIAEAWPATASFYAFIGMPVNLSGLEIGNVGYQLVDGTSGIEITGNIVNPTARTQDVPLLEVTLRDAEGNEVLAETADSGLVTLEPGAVMPFRIRVPNNPKAQELEVRLSGVDDAGNADESGE